MEISVEELNELLQKEFERGKQSKSYITNDRYDYILRRYDTSNTYDKTACTNCSNNPKNGGSGICNCILGMQSYYSTTSDNIK